MGERQRAILYPAVADLLARPDDGDSICTLSAINAAGEEVWVQLIAGGSLNTQYPPNDEPMRKLGELGVFGTLRLSLVEWEAGNYATFDLAGIAARDVVFVIDQLFVKLLQCDDAGYEPASSFE